MKKIAFCAVFLAAAGCSKQPNDAARKPVIGVSLLNLSSEYIVMLDKAMEARAKDVGVELVVSDAQLSAAR